MSASFDTERGFISKLLQTKDIMSVKDNQIKPNYFSGENRLAYQFIYDTVLSTGEVPSVRAFQRKFPRYELDYVKVNGEEVVGTEENIKFWCDELRLKVKHNTLADMVNSVAEKLQDFDTEDAYSLLKKKIAYIESEVVESSDVDLTKGTEDRIRAYLDRKNNKGMRGIPTGFKHLDYILKGLEDETLTTLIANTGVGKTWLEIIIGANCQLQNYRVLQFVTEMSEEIMRDRYEAVLFAKCYGAMNYNAFKSGALSLEDEKKYFEFLEEDLPNFEPLIIATATGVMGVSAAIDKYDPDIILIDSAYLMEDDQGAKDDWLRVAHITRDLKKLAKRCKKPIFINTQADKNTSKKTGPELGSIMYTQAIGQDCLPKDTLILTDEGYKRIQRLEGEVFKVFDGEHYKKAYCTPTGEKPVTVITYRGTEFRCSPEHKIYVYDEQVGNFVWKKAKDIEPINDFLLEQNFVALGGHSHVLLYDTVRKGFKSEMTIPTSAGYNLGRFLGIFIGDGSLKPVIKGQVTVSCGQDLEYAEDCLGLVKSLFNLDGSITTMKSSSSGKDEYLATWYSVSLADWLFKFTHDEKGDKNILIDYAELKESFRTGLLSGLIQSDGSCCGQPEFVTSIQRNAEVFNLLCKSLGLCTRYDFELNDNKGKFRVRIMTEDFMYLPVHFVGVRNEQYQRLLDAKYCGRLPKPASFVKKFCRKLKGLLEVNSLDYKKVCEGARTGKLGQSTFNKYCSMPYKFMQVDDVVTTTFTEPMWSIQVYDKNKRILTNGIVTHNSDNVLALYRDEIMINDREMGLKVLKQREGTLGKMTLNWDFDSMNFSEIYMEQSKDNAGDIPDNTLDVLEEE